ncbi:MULTISPECIES: glucan ABC transporter ATP-binding protein/ permease [Phyllobacteriaceae]|uniref:Glucan ABC transporter ATP-binding protein/ permease n=1 Tax=Ollibium composti TaxID=2675109 RepID=A0ABY2Q9K3_9HYPH|nr:MULTISPECIES: glucan ABC transporter ATP-binding protein/ permease [Mesorhizobium]QDB99445.1 glucan ABC transporter ATP-binding protein/ permease [Mesorhizobium sp. 8]THF58548.1 glucan ABC transporter ATP-binding protein/ permease [Mesorhizobium composti]
MSILQIYWRALGYLAADKKRVFFICFANVALAVIAILEPIMFGHVIDSISDHTDVVPPLAMWAGLGAFNIVAFVLVARSADRFAHARRSEVLCESFERIITMPLSWHHQRGTSNSLHTLLRAVETLFSLWLEFMRLHLSTVVALALLIPTALSLDLRMSVVLIVLGVLYFAIGRLVMRRTKEGQASVERHYHKVFAHVTDSVTNISVLQSYNRIGHETEALKRYATDLLKAQNPVLDWWAIASALNRLSSTISMMVVLMIGAYLVTQGQLRIGEVIAFTGFATLLIARLDQVSAFVNQISEARAKLEEFYRLEDSAVDEAEPEGLRDLNAVTGHIRFENVGFEFAASSQGVEDVSFEVQAGQTVAIVGPTGAGKTTLINLLQRVYAPQKGRILIDGVDTRTVTRKSLRHAIATVFQDAGLLNRSIEDNIRIGRADASNDDVHAAAEAAVAQDFILAKSEGYDTIVGERGGQLSGGERQRIAIARAVLKDAPILVLDEATSALDVETEGRVKEAIDDLRRDRTTFIIAHRLSTVRDADLVIFMDKGQVVEQGGFVELSMRNGRFASLLRAGGLLNDEEVRRMSRLSAVQDAAA